MQKLLQSKARLLLLMLLMLGANSRGQVNENFNSMPSSTSYGNYTYNGFSIINGLKETAAAYARGGAGFAIRLNQTSSPSLTYVGSDGNGKDGGVGVISFWYRHWDGSPSLNFTVEYSINNGAYTQIGSVTNFSSTSYTQFSYTLNNSSDNIKVRVSSNANERLIIDDFSITNFACTAPAITTQPANQTVTEGTNATFSVTASGTSPTYQWQLSTNDGSSYSDITGATASSYTVTPTTTALTGRRYRVVVSNGCGSVTSNGAILTVNANTVPTLSATPASTTGYTYDFGYGPSASQSYSLTGSNLSPESGTVTVTSNSAAFEVSTDNINFSSSVNVSYTGGALASTPVYVRLAAGQAVSNYTSQTITNSGGGATANHTVSGSVAPALPEIAVSGNGFDIAIGDSTPQTADNTFFAAYDLAVNETHSRTFTISNEGTGVLNVTNIAVTNSAFTISGPTSFAVAAGATQNFTVDFNAAEAGTYNGTVTVTNNDSNEGTYTFAVRASAAAAAPQINVTGNNMTIADGDTTPYFGDNTQFAQQDVASPTGFQAKTFRVSNNGNQNLIITAISINDVIVYEEDGSSNPVDFEVTANPATQFLISSALTFPVVIAPGDHQDIDITFNPEMIGWQYAEVSLVNNVATGSLNQYTYFIKGNGLGSDIAVTGNGNAVINGSTTVSSTNNTYLGAANAAEGESVSKMFTIMNTGNASLTIGSVTFSGEDAANFSASVTPATIAAGATGTLTVTATPPSTGFINATISIPNNDPIGDENPYTFAVQAFGSSYVECAVNTAGTIISQDFEGAGLADPTKWGGSFSGNSGSVTTGTAYAGGSTTTTSIDAASLQYNNATGTFALDAVNTQDYSDVVFSFRLASFSSGSTTNGADVSDNVIVQVSEDGSFWNDQVTIAGFSNARWSFTSGTGTASATYNDSQSYQPASSGDRTTDGYSTVTVTGLPSVSTLYIRILVNNNSSAEIWSIDNIELSGAGLAQKTYADGTWSGDGNPPTSSERAIIASDLTLTEGTLNACELVVNEGVTLTVGTAATETEPATIASLNIQSAVTNNGTIIIHDDSALVQHNDAAVNTGDITYNKLSNELFRLDYTFWSSPVTGQNLQDFSPLTVESRFFTYGYNGTQEAYMPILPATNNFQPGIAYLIRMPNQLNVVSTPDDVTADYLAYNAGTYQFAYNGQFTGIPNNGAITVPASTQGNRVTGVGNPYPSPINVSDFFDANQGVLNNGSTSDGNNEAPALYFWRKKNDGTVSSYATLTLGGFVANAAVPEDLEEEADPTYQYGGQNQEPFYAAGNEENWLIAPAQGFLVQAAVSPATPNIVFNNQMRRTSPEEGVSFFRNGNPISHLWLNIKGAANGFSQLVVGYKEGASVGLDYGYDGNIINNGPVMFYSLVQGHNLAIQTRPAFQANDVVPVGFKVNNAGRFTISVGKKDGLFAEGQQVYIKDNQLGITQEITEGEYTFTTEAGTFEDRFEVVYVTDGQLGTDAPVLDAASVIAYKNGNDLKIASSLADITGITVYDINGRLLYNNNEVNAAEATVSGLTLQRQVIIIKINTVKGEVSKKIVW